MIFSLVTKSESFDHLPVPNERAVFLFSGISAEAISRVHLEMHKVSIKMLAVLAEIGRFGVSIPFNARTGGIDQVEFEAISSRFLCNCSGTARTAMDPVADSPPSAAPFVINNSKATTQAFSRPHFLSLILVSPAQ